MVKRGGKKDKEKGRVREKKERDKNTLVVDTHERRMADDVPMCALPTSMREWQTMFYLRSRVYLFTRVRTARQEREPASARQYPYPGVEKKEEKP